MASAERALPVYLQKLRESENLGEEILADQQQIVELDSRRQSNRQAVRAVVGAKEEKKMWCMMGNEFVKVERETLEKWLRSDQNVLDKEINDLRNGMKDKVSALQKLEGKELPKGFYLNAMSKEDLSNISSTDGRIKERYVS